MATIRFEYTITGFGCGRSNGAGRLNNDGFGCVHWVAHTANTPPHRLLETYPELLIFNRYDASGAGTGSGAGGPPEEYDGWGCGTVLADRDNRGYTMPFGYGDGWGCGYGTVGCDGHTIPPTPTTSEMPIPISM